ncbi:MAG TPA: ornithine carbamoyltransferase [bacterium]|mgnify:FL=1|nr:ornithine carbamoyltransferase [bacterium]HOL66970.1 ornithine carbamoyltransferase [bacterium]HPP11160.1 ornithine carbamoyltransferase [bacterium]
MKRDFLEVTDLTREEVWRIFDRAKYFKQERSRHRQEEILAGKHLGLLFSKPSTRTRVSFEVAILELGGTPIYLAGQSTQVSRGETIKDTARVLSRYLSGLVVRTFKQEEVKEYGRWFAFPVINALTDTSHPCQALSDYFTILEKKKTFDGLCLTYIGDPNNVCNSLVLMADLLGVSIRISSPPGYPLSPLVRQQMRNPQLLKVSTDPAAFIADADVIYTDTWVSMGSESKEKERIAVFREYQVNENLLSRAKKDFLFMHCLPAHRGQEVTDTVIDGENSVVIDQAENRLHCQKALLEFLHGG